MSQKNILPKAFSLVEISLVMLLIAVVLTGLLKSTSLIGKSRFSAAQTITKRSPVNEIPDLLAWFETTLDSSFIDSEKKDGSQISTWQDINPNASPLNNAYQSTDGSRPRYYKNLFNSGIPGIRFDGVDDSLLFFASPLINNSYTIFVVEQRGSANSNNYFLGGSATNSNTNLYLGYKDSSTLIFSHYLNDLTFTVPSYDKKTARIHTFYFNVSSGKKYWLNGGTTVDMEQPAETQALESYATPAIGRSDHYYYNGDIAEIIIFSRSLQTQEKELVETYLSKKFNIAIN